MHKICPWTQRIYACVYVYTQIQMHYGENMFKKYAILEGTDYFDQRLCPWNYFIEIWKFDIVIIRT